MVPKQDQDGFYYEINSILHGSYDHKTNTIAILENGIMSISNGKLSIMESADDYKCDEVWVRLTEEYESLKEFLEFQFKTI